MHCEWQCLYRHKQRLLYRLSLLFLLQIQQWRIAPVNPSNAFGGFVLSVTTVEAVATHPFKSVTVTVYVPGKEAVGFWILGLDNPGPCQKYDRPGGLLESLTTLLLQVRGPSFEAEACKPVIIVQQPPHSFISSNSNTGQSAKDPPPGWFVVNEYGFIYYLEVEGFPFHFAWNNLGVVRTWPYV